MSSITSYGDFPGVKVVTRGGGIIGIEVGREQKLIIIGNGDPTSGSASVNTPTQISSNLDADRKFGSGTELAEAMKEARGNGANISYLYGVMYEEKNVTGETVTASSSGTLANAPIIEDTSTISVQDTVDAVSATVEFRYGNPPSTPTSSNTVFINPITGEWVADSSSDYSFDYSYPDYTTALQEASSVIEVEDSGIIANLSENENIATDLSQQVNSIRPNYKMAIGLQPAQPNSNSNDNRPKYDTSTYTDNIDNDAMFLHAPARKKSSKNLITGALAGLMAGNPLSDSIYRESLSTDDLYQRLSETDCNNLRGEEVIPIKQPQTGGSIVVNDNLSTSQKTDWERDYWRKRIVDQVILLARAVGNAVIGQINDKDTRRTVEETLSVELRGLANDSLIKPNTSNDTNWFVEVYEIDADTVGIDIGVTPYGIVKRVDTTITINA